MADRGRAKWLRWFVVVIVALCQTGCWDRVEVNDLLLITATGVDLTPEGKVRLSVQVVIPTAVPGAGQTTGGDTEPFYVIAAEDETVADAARKMQESTPRRFFWGHNQAIVVGARAAKAGVAPYLSFFARHPESRFPPVLYVTPGEASQLLTARTTLESVPSESLRELPKYGAGLETRFRSFLSRLNDMGEDPFATRIEVTSVAPPGAPGRRGKEEFRMTGTAIFQDDRMVGWMDDRESRGIMWLRGEYKAGVLTVAVPLDGGREGRPPKLNVQVIRSVTRLTPVMERGRLTINASVYAETQVVETMSAVDVSKPEIVRKLEDSLEAIIAERVKLTLDRARELRADVFGFGRVVHRGMPGLWRGLKSRWREEFPEIPVRVDVTVRIRRSGKSNKALLFLEREYRETQQPRREAGE